METPTDQVNTPAEAASKLNTGLARRVTRWKRLRLAVAIVQCGIAVFLAFFQSVAVLAVPFFMGAFIAYLLYLDARDQAREVKARTWGSATPWPSKLIDTERAKSAKDTKKHK